MGVDSSGEGLFGVGWGSGLLELGFGSWLKLRCFCVCNICGLLCCLVVRFFLCIKIKSFVFGRCGLNFGTVWADSTIDIGCVVVRAH